MAFRCHGYLSLTPRVPYAALVSTFERIEATTKRLEILNILTQFLLVVAKRDTSTEAKDSSLLKVVYLCINRVSVLIIKTESTHRSFVQTISVSSWASARCCS